MGKNIFIDFPSVSQIWSCLEIIVHRAISSSLDVIALFRIDQEQQDKLVQLCIAAIRYADLLEHLSSFIFHRQFVYFVGKICCQLFCRLLFVFLTPMS